VEIDIQQAERDYDLNRAAELKFGKLTELQQQLEAAEANLEEQQTSGRALTREEVTEEDIAEIISKWTGIPVSKLVQSEMQKLLLLEDELHQRVIGQDEAVTAVADCHSAVPGRIGGPQPAHRQLHLPRPHRGR
jgi:ATP-dependent Clp protease ATP-binding subunit ClpB